MRLTTEENETLTVTTKSVIVATGGFSANSQMLVKYRLTPKVLVTTNHKGQPAAVSRCWNASVPVRQIWARSRSTQPLSRKPRT